jgi:hypothetical protein
MIEAFVENKKIEGRTRIEIDFPNAAAMVDWFEQIKGTSHLPSDVALFNRDALDTNTSSHNIFIVKRDTDRPDNFRLKIVETNERSV